MRMEEVWLAWPDGSVAGPCEVLAYAFARLVREEPGRAELLAFRLFGQEGADRLAKGRGLGDLIGFAGESHVLDFLEGQPELCELAGCRIERRRR